MEPADALVLVTEDSATVSTVAAALDRNGEFGSANVCGDLQQLAVRLDPAPALAVLVDIDPQPRRMLADLEPIITRFANTRFILLSRARDDELILEAMQIGARHFLLKQTVPGELANVLERLIPSSAPEIHRNGVVITVFSASGGCGATTLAVNLANELQLMNADPALLIDLDCCYGAVGSYLGLDGEYGIVDVLADRARIDSQLIRSTAVPYSENLHILLSPASINVAEPLSPEYRHLTEALNACKAVYGYTVIDAPRVPQDVAVQLAKASQLALIVFQLSVKDIRHARFQRAGLIDRGVPAEVIVPLANRHRKRSSMIGLKEAQRGLGGVAPEWIRNDFRGALRGINYGQPLAKAARRSALRRDLRRLAEKVKQLKPSPGGGSRRS